jgi:two-component system, NarL family, sensor kinase
MDEKKIIIVSVVGSLVTIILCIAVLGFFVIYQRKKAQQLAEQALHQQQILQTQIEIQQQSFHNIAQEIHDNIGQVLSLIKLNLGSVSAQTEAYPFHEKITGTLQLTGQVINDLRHLSKGLNPDFVEQFGLAGCIEFELERLQNSGLFKTDFSSSGKPRKLKLAAEFVLYRVVQECINNIIKHAAASEIKIAIHFAVNELAITVADDGKGFDTHAFDNPSPAQKGSGLGNMKKRLEAIGGHLHISSNPGQGTLTTLQVFTS